MIRHYIKCKFHYIQFKAKLTKYFHLENKFTRKPMIIDSFCQSLFFIVFALFFSPVLSFALIFALLTVTHFMQMACVHMLQKIRRRLDNILPTPNMCDRLIKFLIYTNSKLTYFLKVIKKRYKNTSTSN